MEKKKLNSNDLRQLVIAAFILVLGVLFCVNKVNHVLSIIIGIGLTLVGVLYISDSYLKERKVLTSEGIVGAALTAFGLMFAVDNLMNLVTGFIPWLLMAGGTAILLDGILRKFVAKDLDIKMFVVEAVVGGVALVFGVCLKWVPSFANFTSLMLGIVLVVYALIKAAAVFLGRGKDEE